jgi:hypothetical protein
MTGQETKVKTRKGKKAVKTAAEKQLSLVGKLTRNLDRIHKRI